MQELQELIVTDHLEKLSSDEIQFLTTKSTGAGEIILQEVDGYRQRSEFDKRGWKLKYEMLYAFGSGQQLNGKQSPLIKGVFDENKKYAVLLYKFTGMNISVKKEKAGDTRVGFLALFGLISELFNWLGIFVKSVMDSFDKYEKEIKSNPETINNGQLDRPTHEDKKDNINLSCATCNPRAPHDNLPLTKSKFAVKNDEANDETSLGIAFVFQTATGEMEQLLANEKMQDEMYEKDIKKLTSGMKVPPGAEAFRIHWVPKSPMHVEPGFLHGIVLIYESE
ncbi:MAG TPA: hypothetical protein VF602_08440 [Pedobacter sp.]|jgi:hypothetical protein